MSQKALIAVFELRILAAHAKARSRLGMPDHRHYLRHPAHTTLINGTQTAHPDGQQTVN